MNLHEYQAKSLLAEYNLPLLPSQYVTSPDAAKEEAQRLGGDCWVAKVQTYCGGRGKAGGVKVLNNPEDVRQFAQHWLGKRLVSAQTDAVGLPVHTLLIEKCALIERELYLGAVIDRTSHSIVFMASNEGGVDIETVAAQSPEKIIHVALDPFLGVLPYQGRQIASYLGFKGEQAQQMTNIVVQLANLFIAKDLSLLEINPLALTAEGQLICLDAKMNIDDNALYRQPELRAMYDKTQVDERESIAEENHLSYVPLDGNIGCIVNGAGLAMGTMDIIQSYGGMPANFLDVGGTATEERVSQAFKLILSDDQVKTVLVNIFGGIVRCDLIAMGIINAIKDIGLTIPVVVRLEGNHAKEAQDMLAASGYNITTADDLGRAARMAVEKSQTHEER